MIFVTILIFALVLAPIFLFSGWVWMLGLGGLSHIFGVPELAIGYWQSVVVAMIISILIGAVK